MNDTTVWTSDERIFFCAGCPYRNRYADFCGVCMQKIIDDMTLVNLPVRNEPEP